MKAFKNIDNVSFDPRWAEAVNIHRSGDVRGSLFLFKKLANDGCAPALIEVAQIYEAGGSGVERDIYVAIDWYKYAIETIDDWRAHLGLGRSYLYLYQRQEAKSFTNIELMRYHFDLVVKHNNHMGALFALALIDERESSSSELVLMQAYYKAAKQGHLLARKRALELDTDKSLLNQIRLLSIKFKIFFIALKKPNDPRLNIF